MIIQFQVKKLINTKKFKVMEMVGIIFILIGVYFMYESYEELK
jgi:hypothetical protein